jgi:predicted nuclease of predicted toxin-antitoxin system
VRFLVDQNRSPLLAESLRDAGHDVVHTFDIGLEAASDPEIFAHAIAERRIIVSADTDFPALLADAGSTSPSVGLFRLRGLRRAAIQARLLLANLRGDRRRSRDRRDRRHPRRSAYAYAGSRSERLGDRGQPMVMARRAICHPVDDRRSTSSY